MNTNFRKAITAMKRGNEKEANLFLKRAQPLGRSYQRIWQRVVEVATQ